VLYSDGLTEAMDAHMNEFGEQRVLGLIRDREPLPATTLQQLLIDDVARHRGDAEQNDDITLVIIRIR
jgi:phosphoserine phosphatase RsbU/P